MEFDEMQLSPIAFVLTETILGKTRAKVPHQSVARHFRDHAGGRDTQAKATAIDQRSLGKGKRENGQPVDQDMPR